MHGLELPLREAKPRKFGITSLIDNGYSTNYFEDVVTSFEDKIDFIKFGWGTSIVTSDFQKKVDILKNLHIDYGFGGTLFEKFLYQNKLEDYKKLIEKYNCPYMEVSNGTIDISNTEKCEHIKEFSKFFNVLSEVGLKDSEKSEEMSPKRWIEYIQEDLDAGACKVITEARESGTSGICRSNGQLRIGLIEEIMESDLNINNIIFEAPSKALQVHFIKKLGSNCNLANIAFTDVVALETLRLGLRSDTLTTFENMKGK